jgi:hypothetical protein
MKRERISSSAIASVGYDPDEQTLEVEFIDGEVYQYLKVPEYIFLDFMMAESRGEYINRKIKGLYADRKIS